MKHSNFKHILALVLVLALGTFCLVGCGLVPQPDPTEPTEAPTDPAPTECAHTGGTATCTEKAVCDLCGEAYGELAAHTWTDVEAKAATCTEDGYTAHKVCACGAIEGKEAVPAGHTWTDVEAKAATCTEDGYTAHKVCACGAIEGKEVVPAGHTWTDVEAKAATCTEDGYTAHKVCACGAIEGKEVVPAGHKWEDVAAKDATCTEDGYTAHKACACGETQGKEVVPAGHKWDDVAAKAATCTEDGYTAHKVCACGETEGKEVVPAAGHSYGDDITCDVCGTCLINADSFTGPYRFEDYEGTAYDREFAGIHATSDQYQPKFYFTAEAVEAIKAYAAANDVNTIRIRTYAKLKDNSFKVGPESSPNGAWGVNDLAIDTLTTSTCFWSQSQGATELYMYFELVKHDPVITASSFTGNLGFYDFTATEKGRDLIGAQYVNTKVNQPVFYLNAETVEAVKAYAAANDYNVLRAVVYVELSNGQFIVNGVAKDQKQWNTWDIPVDELTTETEFKSEATSQSKIWIYFEFDKVEEVPLINASSFTGSFSFEDFEGTAYDREFVGIHVTSDKYQPKFYFTAEAVEAIKAYAAANDVNTIRVYTYSKLKDNKFKVGAEFAPNNAWGVNDLAIDTLDTSTCFWSQSQGTTELYMYFELVKFDPVITASSFTGNLGFYDFTATEQGRDLIGAKYVNTTVNQPTFYLNAETVEAVKVYAAENGYTILRAVVYVDLSNGQFIVNGEAKPAKQWNTWDISIDELSTETEFKSEATSRTKIWIYFEFA